MIAVRAALAGFLIFGVPSWAAEAPPAVRLGEFKVVFGATRLSQLREAVGAGLIDRHAGLSWLCYTVPDEAAAQRIWITSTQGLEADSFTVELLPEHERPSPACPALPPRFLPLSISGAISLGMTLVEIEQRIGARAKPAGPYLEFSSPHSGGMRPVQARRIVVEVLEGRVVRLWVEGTAA